MFICVGFDVFNSGFQIMEPSILFCFGTKNEEDQQTEAILKRYHLYLLSFFIEKLSRSARCLAHCTQTSSSSLPHVSSWINLPSCHKQRTSASVYRDWVGYLDPFITVFHLQQRRTNANEQIVLMANYERSWISVAIRRAVWIVRLDWSCVHSRAVHRKTRRERDHQW